MSARVGIVELAVGDDHERMPGRRARARRAARSASPRRAAQPARRPRAPSRQTARSSGCAARRIARAAPERGVATAHPAFAIRRAPRSAARRGARPPARRASSASTMSHDERTERGERRRSAPRSLPPPAHGYDHHANDRRERAATGAKRAWEKRRRGERPCAKLGRCAANAELRVRLAAERREHGDRRSSASKRGRSARRDRYRRRSS